MVGKTVSHYRILSQLGAGGMGVVYAAEDPRLNRHVALKFVPEDLAHDPHSLERLRSEARTASSLNHPNICTIYDIGEYEGRPFIVMELLKGQTLRERMEAGRLKIPEAVEIGLQASDALFWAHSKDVIHRDIKPANLFLCEPGPLKILDFGLAKFVPPQPAEQATLAPTVDLTGVGVAVGTVAYMSPEQVSGDRLDRRTDLFSLGVVLYECVTGQQPFQGKTSAVILASILTHQPTPPIELNSNVPPGLQDVIHTCLEKDRELRYQDAGSLRADLKRVKRDLESGALRTAAITASVRALARDSASSAEVAVRPQRDATVASAVVTPHKSHRGLVIGLSAAALLLLAALITVLYRGSSTVPAPQTAAATPSASPAAPEATAGVNVGDAAEAERRRADAARFNDAIVEGNLLLVAGDADGANRSLSVARSIDPSSPAVADLSARLIEHFRAIARKPPSELTRPAPPAPAPRPVPEPPPQRPSPPPPVAAAAPPVAPTPASTSTASSSASSNSAASPPAQEPVPNGRGQIAEPPRPPVAEQPPAPATPPPARAETPERRGGAAAPPAQPAEDDDAAIRRLVAAYGRAIETKDIGLFRALKPNLTPAERQTIEQGFRAVTSQQVTLTVQSIDRQGPEAFVRVKRHDVVDVNGRQRTVDSDQALRLLRTPGGWVIVQIGR